MVSYATLTTIRSRLMRDEAKDSQAVVRAQFDAFERLPRADLRMRRRPGPGRHLGRQRAFAIGRSALRPLLRKEEGSRANRAIGPLELPNKIYLKTDQRPADDWRRDPCLGDKPFWLLWSARWLLRWPVAAARPA
jgi:hypothetical protein